MKMFIYPDKRGLSVLLEAKRPVGNGNSIPINHDFWLIVITDVFFSFCDSEDESSCLYENKLHPLGSFFIILFYLFFSCVK